jgi:hypothetical protein
MKIFSPNVTGSLLVTGSVNTISGSLTITGIVKSTTTPLVSGSSQISYTGITDKPNLISGSSQINITGTTGYSAFSSSIATTDLNQTNRINSLEISTGSLNTFTSSASGRLSSLESASGSIRTDFNTYTSSNNTTNTTQNSRLTSLESASGSIRTDFNTYTSSNNTTNTTQNSRLTSIESVTGSISSLNTYTGSNNTVIGTLQTATSSLNTFTSSANGRLSSLETASGSIRTDFNTYTSSNNTTNTTQNSRLGALETATGSIITVNTTQNSRLTSLETATGSIITVNTTQNSRLTSLESASGSIRTDFNTYTGSNNTTNTTQNSRLTSLETTTGSLNSYTGSNNTVIGTLQTATSSLNTFSNSFNSAFSLSGADVTVRGNFTVSGTTTTINSTTVNIADNIIQLNGSGAANAGLVVRDATSPNTISGSLLWDSTNDRWIAGELGSEQPIVLNGQLNTYTSSANSRLTSLESASSSIRTDFNSYTSSNNTTVTTQNSRLTSLETSTGSLNAYTSSANTKLSSIETSTSSLNTFTSSINTTIKTRLNAEGVVSGSSQITYGGISGIPGGIVSGSSQIDLTATTNYSSGIKTRLNAEGVISGSSQVTGIANSQLTNSSFHVGTTLISLGRASASQTLTGVSIDGNAATATSATDSTKLPLAGGTMTGIITTVSSGTAINFSGQSDSFGYNTTSGQGTYIKGTGSTYLYGGGTFFDGSTVSALLHSGNFTSYAMSGAGFSANQNLNTNDNVTFNSVTGAITSSGNGDGNAPFRFAADYSGWMSIVAGTPGSNNGWGLFWAGNSGAQYGTNGASGPGNIWSNADNPNEFVFVGNGGSRMSIYGNNGNVWMGGDVRMDGNVGVGVSPSVKFHVRGSGEMIRFENTSTGANEYTQLNFKAGSRNGYIWLGNQNTSSWAGDGGLNIYTDSGHMDFWTNTTQKTRISTNGTLLHGHVSVLPTESAWLGTAVFGASGYNKVMCGSLNSTTTGAYVVGHNSALNAWADLNIAGESLIFRYQQTERARFDTSGHFIPGANNAYNLGSPSLGWANVYTNDLHLSNMNKPEGNDIDGTSGNWTIQEGSENLYIINNNNGKKFKISLEEII